MTKKTQCVHTFFWSHTDSLLRYPRILLLVAECLGNAPHPNCSIRISEHTSEQHNWSSVVRWLLSSSWFWVEVVSRAWRRSPPSNMSHQWKPSCLGSPRDKPVFISLAVLLPQAWCSGFRCPRFHCLVLCSLLFKMLRAEKLLQQWSMFPGGLTFQVQEVWLSNACFYLLYLPAWRQARYLRRKTFSKPLVVLQRPKYP